jgi:hypothetical protein
MQIVSSDYALPERLMCSGCRHWERSTVDSRAEAEATGRCGRFGEARPASARPRCNICWEPATPSVSDTALADG